MDRFEEIEGAILEDISTSNATYVSAKGDSAPLQVQGCSLVFDLGWFVIENPFTVFNFKNENIESDP